MVIRFLLLQSKHSSPERHGEWFPKCAVRLSGY
jgi:hypothetical protein